MLVIRRSRSSSTRLCVPGRSRGRAVVSFALWAAIAYYFFAILRHVDWRVVAAQRVDPTLALVVVTVGVSSRFLLPVVWTIALSALEGKGMPFRLLLWPYAQSWMGRYLPGKVGLIGTRILAARKASRPTRSNSATASRTAGRVTSLNVIGRA